jgi:hypothetical protein
MAARLKPWLSRGTACHFLLIFILFPVSSPLSIQRPWWHTSSAPTQLDSNPGHAAPGKQCHKDFQGKISLEANALAWSIYTLRGSQGSSAFLRKCRRPPAGAAALPSFVLRKLIHTGQALSGKGASEDENSKDWIHEGDIVIIGGQRFQRKNGRFSNLDVSPQEIEYNVQIELASIREGAAAPEEDERFEDDDFEKDPAQSLEDVSMSRGRGDDGSSAGTPKDESDQVPGTSPSLAVKEPNLDAQGEIGTSFFVCGFIRHLTRRACCCIPADLSDMVGGLYNTEEEEMLFRHLEVPTDPVRAQKIARAVDPCMASCFDECTCTCTSTLMHRRHRYRVMIKTKGACRLFLPWLGEFQLHESRTLGR